MAVRLKTKKVIFETERNISLVPAVASNVVVVTYVNDEDIDDDDDEINRNESSKFD